MNVIAGRMITIPSPLGQCRRSGVRRPGWENENLLYYYSIGQRGTHRAGSMTCFVAYWP
ncbi:hypothetical protein SXCC_01586 [Gluconacetobacter sp. SXCC-1]|nr:hypothetical protein SXCC_01586 [Gluconacetobacter sp. SXCC-1]